MDFKEYLMEDALSAIIDYRGKTPQKAENGIPTLSAKSVKNNYINYAECYYISEAEYKRFMVRGFPKKGDILLTTEAPMGMVARLDRDDIAIAQRLLTLRGKEGVLDNDYLLYLLQSPYGQGLLKAKETGTTVTGIKQAEFRRVVIKLPDIAVQKKVTSILNAIDSKISCNTKINDNLQQQAQTLFAEHFCLRSGDSIPDGWSLISLGDVAVISNKSFNPLKQPETMLEHYSIPAFDETRYPVFELSTAIKSNKFVVDADCFMISKLNPTTKRVWRPYCMTNNAVCSTEFIVYKAKERMLTDFLYSLIDSVPFSDFMCSHVTGSTGSRQRTIPSDTLQYQFYLPTAEEIAAFSAVVAPMYAQVRINAMENARLKDLRDSLLPRLMSGDIEVSAIGI
ncbi:MAG: restriction endonuclease subunit S [Oscillospiraceae bacterium]|nr:restriction endonuclease subunit S [Oscillospiraceae bacterium]